MSPTQLSKPDRQNGAVHTNQSERFTSQQPNSGARADQQDEEIFQSRRNGWSCPPHWQQLIGWLVLIILGFFHFTTIVPGIPTLPAQIVGYAVCNAPHVIACIIVYFVFACPIKYEFSLQLSGIYAAAIVALLIASTSIDPADDFVRSKSGKVVTGKFNPENGGHVIEQFYCKICETQVYLNF